MRTSEQRRPAPEVSFSVDNVFGGSPNQKAEQLRVFRFLHAADIHLDSPLRGLSRYDGAPLEALRGATRRALENLVEKAIELQVDFLLLAGDLYDGDWRDYNTGLFFLQQMSRLEQARIPVFAISGNHDAENRLTRRLALPPNVTLFSADKAESVQLEPLGVWIHGQSFKQAEVLEDLSRNYPSPRAHCFNIGLLHTSADGREGHAAYAPCSLDSLRSKGYDYWALGHIHKREVLSEEPWVVFPGNLQGRHAKETGPKGATLVTVSEGAVVSVEPIALDVVRWARVEVDIKGARTPEQVLAKLQKALDFELEQAQQRLLACRVEISGRSPMQAELRAEPEHWLQEVRGQGLRRERVWIERVRFTGQAPQRPHDMARQDALGSVLQGLRSLSQEPDELEELGRSLFGKLEAKLPAPWREGEDGVRPTDPEALSRALDDVAEMLRSRLSGAPE